MELVHKRIDHYGIHPVRSAIKNTKENLYTRLLVWYEKQYEGSNELQGIVTKQK
jgi:hypothetical protein